MEKIFTYSKGLDFDEIFRKDVTYDNLKSHKKNKASSTL